MAAGYDLTYDSKLENWPKKNAHMSNGKRSISSDKATKSPGKCLGPFWYSCSIFLIFCQLLYKPIFLYSIITEQLLCVRYYVRHW